MYPPGYNRGVRQSFLLRYLEAFHRIEGWFSYDAALLFMAYNQLLAAHGIAADVLEIGVHHGLSTIALAALRAPGSKLYVVDLFERLQAQNTSRSGSGNRQIFERNMREFFGDTGFLKIVEGDARSLARGSFAGDFSFCHVDGGHSRTEVVHDLELAVSLLLPGGIVALDDYFNPEFPEVCEGALEFSARRPGVLAALACGYNKVLFQKLPAPFDTNAAFRAAFPEVRLKEVGMWSSTALLFPQELRSYFDLYASTPHALKPMGAEGPRAILSPTQPRAWVRPCESTTVPVEVRNVSKEEFPAGKQVFGLSYHLLAPDGKLLRHDNERTWFDRPLPPGGCAVLDLRVEGPAEPGAYRMELDLVWEQVMWFKDVGNPTSIVELEVSES